MYNFYCLPCSIFIGTLRIENCPNSVFVYFKGGMKAVIWTDVFQASVMVVGLVVVLIVGAKEVDGFKNVFDIADKGERLKVFDFNPDPRIRNTFWTLSIGGAFTAMPVWTVSQTAVQRFLSAKSAKTAQRYVVFNILILIPIQS